ncbi:MAG: type IV secretion system DNA-binding domain-containing protein [Caulobacterales bacterium]|nr:type IV secretion system DNA-binding domain-containing protein [Caulobacterales bacterium]
MNDELITYFAITCGRPPSIPFGIFQSDRALHMYVLGKTGTGKSTLLEALAMSDIRNRNGLILIDPHGDLAERLVARIPDERAHHLIYVQPGNGKGVWGYNPLKNVRPEYISRAVSGLLETMRFHFGEKSWGSRMEHILRNVLYALLEYGNATLPDILRMLSEKDFRNEVVRSVTNTQVKYFFQHEFSKLWGRTLFDAIAPIQNKVGSFLTDPILMQTLVEHQNEISFRRAMDTNGIIIINLARGILGNDTAHFLGSIFTQTITLAAMSRLELPPNKRTPCYLYLDEFEHFVTKSMALTLSEVRKVGLALVLANQYLHQLPPDIHAAILGNVGTLVCFRTGAEDARYLAKSFGDEISMIDILHLSNHHFFIQLMIHGEPSKVFSGKTSLTLSA